MASGYFIYLIRHTHLPAYCTFLLCLEALKMAYKIKTKYRVYDESNTKMLKHKQLKQYGRSDPKLNLHKLKLNFIYKGASP